ncbi:MAG: apolipoprotein N-acyltransferase [Bacteroidetes bacterium]|nr:apolipoprotein N-acyltransferase [Bacteroidota bacterium]MBM3424084.1 apolipoprotein N-acyltransferase [Bacteroidota bacterium]
MKHIIQHSLFLSIVSGILLMLAFPFSGSLTPLVFVAWVPLWCVAFRLKNTKRGALRFFAYSYLSLFLFNLGTTWWIWNATSGGAVMAFICNTLLMAGSLGLGFIAFRRLTAPWFIAGLSLTWLVFEFAHLNWELSWPWLTMGNFFSLRPSWVQWYEYTGILGGSLWVMAANWSGTLFTEQRKRYGYAIALAALLFLPYCISIGIQAFRKQPSNPRLQATVLLQPNIDPYTEKFSTDPVAQLQRMVALAQPYLQPKALVVGPETALQEAFVEANYRQTQSSELLNGTLQKSQTHWLIGASTFKVFSKKQSAACRALPNGLFYESYNTSAFLGSEQTNFIHKSKLVLGVEKIPFSTWLPFLEEWSINNGGTSGSLGIEPSPKIFRTEHGAYAPIICYESIYGAFVGEQCRQGAELLCIITNDGWWGKTPGHRQHNQFAALRAIETRKYVVRSGNTGISSVWSPEGACLKSLGYGKTGVVATKVPMLQGKTFYVQYGDYLGWVSMIAVVGLFAGFTLSKKKK